MNDTAADFEQKRKRIQKRWEKQKSRIGSKSMTNGMSQEFNRLVNNMYDSLAAVQMSRYPSDEELNF